MEFIWLLAGHFLGDFAFQTGWMAAQKAQLWDVNAYHAAVYTATMLVVAAIGGIALSLPVIGILFVTHFFIDPLKSRWHIIKNIWTDQLLHLLVLIAILPLI